MNNKTRQLRSWLLTALFRNATSKFRKKRVQKQKKKQKQMQKYFCLAE